VSVGVTDLFGMVARYEVMVDARSVPGGGRRVFRFTRRRDALWALRFGTTTLDQIRVKVTARDRWTGRAIV
jgi:hypothetical protein